MMTLPSAGCLLLLTLCCLTPLASCALTPITSSGCSVSKSCFKSPDSCSGKDCTYFASWKALNVSGQLYLEVELVGMVKSSSGYIAIGFSSDNKMGDDGVLACVASGAGPVSVSPAFNRGKSNFYVTIPAGFLAASDATGLLGGAFDASGNILSCRFRRHIKPTSNTAYLKDLSSPNKYYLLISRSSSTNNGGLAQHFTGGHAVTGSSYDLQANEFTSGSQAKFTLVKAHAALMMLAWLLLSAIGIIMARGYKSVWVEEKLCSQAVWFQIHRSLQITAVLCTILAFILIFVHVGGYSPVSKLPGKAHPILGIIVTILAIANPIVALFRCGPTDHRRPIFNWVHFTIGTLAQIFALATIFIGVKMPQAGAKFAEADYPIWLLIAYCVFCVIMEIAFYVNGARISKARGRGEHEPENKHVVKSACTIQKLFLGIYILGVGSLTLTLVILMALN